MHREWDRNDIFTKLICLPQLALPVEFLYEILCVGAPSPTRIACRISLRNSLCWGPANFHCLLNFFTKFSVLGPRQLPLPV
ncbi:hypothetical protein B7437_08755 [Staphylococcus aureus]|nr:hypothetical protein B7437_08755 [Staphylococcus aureus]